VGEDEEDEFGEFVGSRRGRGVGGLGHGVFPYWLAGWLAGWLVPGGFGFLSFGFVVVVVVPSNVI
jgi:hypothetical protein